jgi:hypothetical protein
MSDTSVLVGVSTERETTPEEQAALPLPSAKLPLSPEGPEEEQYR